MTTKKHGINTRKRNKESESYNSSLSQEILKANDMQKTMIQGSQWVKSPLGTRAFQIRVPVEVLAALLPNQLLPSMPGNTPEDGPSTQTPTTYVGDQDEFLAPTIILLQPGCCSYLKSDPKDGISCSSFPSPSPPFCLTTSKQVKK